MVGSRIGEMGRSSERAGGPASARAAQFRIAQHGFVGDRIVLRGADWHVGFGAMVAALGRSAYERPGAYGQSPYSTAHRPGRGVRLHYGSAHGRTRRPSPGLFFALRFVPWTLWLAVPRDYGIWDWLSNYGDACWSANCGVLWVATALFA